MSSIITLQLELAPIHERVGCNGDGFEFGTVGNDECVVGGNGWNGRTHGETPLPNHNTLQLLHAIQSQAAHTPKGLGSHGELTKLGGIGSETPRIDRPVVAHIRLRDNGVNALLHGVKVVLVANPQNALLRRAVRSA